MKKYVFLGSFLFFSLALFVSGCAKNNLVKENLDQKIKVAATIFPLYDIVQSIAQDKIETKLILPPGSSPHTFEVSPQQVKNIQGTKVFFIIGQGVDSWVQGLFQNTDNAEIFSVDKNIHLQEFEHEDVDESESSDEYEHKGVDPHYWLSPENAVIITQDVLSKLVEIDPENQTYYEKNAFDFINQLQGRSVGWKEKIKNLDNKELVVFHDAWGYFSKYFDLEILATFEPFPGKIPSPKYLANLQNSIKIHNTKALFVEPQLSFETVRALSEDLGINIAVLDPLGGTEGRNGYISLIDFNIESIITALK